MRRLALPLALLLLTACSARPAPSGPAAPGAPPAGSNPPAAAAPGGAPGNPTPGGGANVTPGSAGGVTPGSAGGVAPVDASGVAPATGPAPTPAGGARPAPAPVTGRPEVPVTALTGPTGGLQRLHAGSDWLLGITYDRLAGSADGGLTWQEIPAPAAAFGLIDVARLPGGALLTAALDGPLLRSDDGGAHWQAVAEVPRAMSISVYGDTVLVAGRQVSPEGAVLPAVYRSDDGGADWTVSSQGFWPGRANAVARDAENPAVLYAGLGDYDFAVRGGGLFRSRDGGQTWVQASAGLPGWPRQILTDRGHVYARTNEGLYRSDDGAQSWQSVSGRFWYATATGVRAWDGTAAGLAPLDLVYDAPHDRLVAATEGGVLLAPPPGTAWQAGGAGLPTLRLAFTLPYAAAGQALFRDGGFAGALPAAGLTLAVSPANPERIFALPGHASGDGGRSWQAIAPLPGGGGPAVALDDQTLLAVAGGRLYRSGDGGGNWAVAAEWAATSLQAGNDSVWATTDRGLYRSGDAGQTWTWSGLGLPTLFTWAVSPDPSDPTRVVALTAGGVAATSDGGETWRPAGAGLPAPPYRAAARLARSPGGRLFFALDGDGVYVAGSEGWRRLAGPGPEGLQDLAAAADDRVAISQFWSTRYLRLTGALPAPAPPPVTGAGPSGWAAPAAGGAVVTQVLIYANDASVALAQTQGSTLFLTRDGGRTWSTAGQMAGRLPETTGIEIPAGRYLGLGGGALYTASTGGRTWERTAVQIGVDHEPEQVSISPDPSDADLVVAAWMNPLIMGGGSGIVRSVDGGRTWQSAWTQPRSEGRAPVRISRLLRDPAQPRVLYAGGDVTLVSRDGGATWQEAGAGSAHSIDGRGTLYGSLDGRPAASADGGATWQRVNLPDGVEPNGTLLQADPGRPGRLFRLGSGLHLSDDGGTTWRELTAGIGDMDVRSLAAAGPDGWYVLGQSGLLFRLAP